MARDKGKHVKDLFAKVADVDRRHFHALSLSARWAVVELTLAYWRDRDRRNPLPISARDLAELIECNKETACRALSELVDAGFLKRARETGIMTGKRSGRVAVYTMTWLDVDGVAGSATFDYREKSGVSGKSRQQRTENPHVSNAAKRLPAGTFNAKQGKGLGGAIFGDFAEEESGTYSQHPSSYTPESPEKFLAAPPSPACIDETAVTQPSRGPFAQRPTAPTTARIA